MNGITHLKITIKKNVMNIRINSDSNITGTEELSNFVESTIADGLKDLMLYNQSRSSFNRREQLQKRY